jgi:hypothetical protein
MDVSTSIVNDPKVRKLWRTSPDVAGVAFTVYISTLAESWKEGRRVHADDAWPAFMPFDEAVLEALKSVELLDAKGFVLANSWREWFSPAQERREQARQRWARYNANRTGNTARLPRGNDAVTASQPRGYRVSTATSVPIRSDPIRNEEENVTPPPAKQGKRENGTNPRAQGTNPRALGTSPRQQREAEKRGPLAPIRPRTPDRELTPEETEALIAEHRAELEASEEVLKW